MKTVLRGVLVFFGAVMLQWWWSTHLSLWGAAPCFPLALTVLLAARRDPIFAMLAGFGWGLAEDFARAELFGSSALALTLGAYAVGLARRRIDLSAAAPLACAAFAVSWAAFLLEGIVGLIFSSRFLWPGWAIVLVSPVLSACACVACSWAMGRGEGA